MYERVPVRHIVCGESIRSFRACGSNGWVTRFRFASDANIAHLVS